MEIIPIPALKDNYIWLLTEKNSSDAWIVDPGDAKAVLNVLKKFNLTLKGILITHHHADHCGGLSELLNNNQNIAVFGAYNSLNPYVNNPIKEKNTFSCLSSQCQAMEIPGHTLDHMAYYMEKSLFCGDTLFSAGCGKIFEGTAQQMYCSLSKLSQLSDGTHIYCGHEYTLKNLYFAYLVDPHNKYLHEKLDQVKIIIENDGCTLPTLLGEEKKINPFLRCTTPEIISAVENYVGKRLNDPIDVFYYLREWKNNL